jgi:hypothetical protein
MPRRFVSRIASRTAASADKNRRGGAVDNSSPSTRTRRRGRRSPSWTIPALSRRPRYAPLSVASSFSSDAFSRRVSSPRLCVKSSAIRHPEGSPGFVVRVLVTLLAAGSGISWSLRAEDGCIRARQDKTTWRAGNLSRSRPVVKERSRSRRVSMLHQLSFARLPTAMKNGPGGGWPSRGSISPVPRTPPAPSCTPVLSRSCFQATPMVQRGCPSAMPGT